MPAWLIPALKAVLPHVGTIVSAATPVFTRRKTGAAIVEPSLPQQQIAELQAAVSENDAHIKELALQVKTTVEALEQSASLADSRHRRVLFLCVTAIIVSATALVFAMK